MSVDKHNIAQTSMSKELIFGQVFAVAASFVSDFLQPLGNITFYIFIFSGAVVLILATAYLAKKLCTPGEILRVMVNISQGYL